MAVMAGTSVGSHARIVGIRTVGDSVDDDVLIGAGNLTTRFCAVPGGVDRQQVQGIYRQGPVPRGPMEVRARNSPCSARQGDYLTSRYSVAHGHQRLAEMEIAGDNPTTVGDVDHSPGKKERVY